MTEDEMALWHHRLNGHEFEWNPGVTDGQGGLPCCDSWGRRESNTTEQLKWTELLCHWCPGYNILFCFVFSVTESSLFVTPWTAAHQTSIYYLVLANFRVSYLSFVEMFCFYIHTQTILPYFKHTNQQISMLALS